MSGKSFAWGAAAIVLAGLAYWWGASGAKEAGSRPGVPPETVADYVHAVIEADRTFYSIHVVERMQKKGLMVASENWRVANTLPLPAQFLMESGELAVKTGTKFRYRLIGLWPINKQNGPANDFERAGLEDVRINSERPFTRTVSEGGERYFQAVYADRAVTQACIGCHNAHPNSPKRDFKLNDVMGGIIITIPLGP